MSETVNANGLQALAGEPSPNSRGTHTANLSGTYQKLYQSGQTELNQDEISIFSFTGGLSPSLSFGLAAQGTDNWESSPDANSSGQYAMFKSRDGKVAYASLCTLFQPTVRCIVIAIYDTQTSGRPGHKPRPGEQPPTGVWIGMSSGGTYPPPADC